MFQKFQKKYQSQNLSKTWQQATKKRVVAKNNYLVNGDLKKANTFARMVSNFTFQTNNTHSREQVIFSSDVLAVPLRPVYVFAQNY